MKINKIQKKLYVMVTMVMIFVFGISFFLNNYLLSNYYLYKMKGKLSYVYDYSKEMNLEDFKINSKSFEDNKNITMLFIKKDNDIESLNENIKNQLAKEKITLSKFWITEEVLQDIENKEYVNKLYYQEKLKSSFLVKFFDKEDTLVVVGTTISHNNDAVQIINQFNVYLIIGSLIVSLILVLIFSKRIISPLEILKDLSKDISNLNFKRVNIKTGDEIEELAESINIMSENLRIAHENLEEKNENLKILISSISHEVKTPLALIKAYSIGIKDGLDDGTYTDVILEQVDSTSKMVDNLLNLSKIERVKVNKTLFNLNVLLNKVLEKYNIILKNSDIKINIDCDCLNQCIVNADKEHIELVLNNLISNAIKYNDGSYINIKINHINKGKISFSIKNKTYRINENNIKKLWEPFYVIEESRNKELSGTGIGLSIVSSILDKNNINYEASLNENEIEFYIEFVKGSFISKSC
ncbi:sensor histidine kinase [Clostridium frigidicarnis]|nr:HAMP domain-containing sensor histidine kinase [Clostridium frigidicarnis]